MAKAKRGDGPNKMGLVREAMASLGGDAKPKAIGEHIKSAAGVEIPTAMISSYKSMILKKGKGKRKGKSGRGPGRPPKSANMNASSGGNRGSVSMTDIAEVKSLVTKHGVSKLSDLIKLFS